jgi:hypothetical protein
MTDEKEGWAYLLNAMKWHYFVAGGRSLCGKWMLLSNRATEEGNDDSSDNCVACRRKLAARRKRAIP